MWDAANEFNIKTNNQNQYDAFTQIRDFYKWVDKKAESTGSEEVKWMDGAIGLVSDLAIYFDGENNLGLDFSPLMDNDLENLLIDLNEGIQNSMLTRFNWLLYGAGSLFGGLDAEEAMQWDINSVNYEQGEIAPAIYDNYKNSDAIPKLQQLVDQDVTRLGIMNTVMLNHVPPFRWFDAKVTDTQARIDIPLLMLYPDQYAPIFSGFNGKTDPDGTLNKSWTELMYYYQVK